MNRTSTPIVRFCAALTAGVALTFLPATPASADSWYGRPNTMTCVYNTVMIDGPTNVPLTGDVTWEATAYARDPATGVWNPWQSSLANRADRVGITPGAWYDQYGEPVFVVSAAIPAGTNASVAVAVYNRFYSWDTGLWVDGFWSINNIDGGMFCSLTGGGIVV
jgi:hypothetical protein